MIKMTKSQKRARRRRLRRRIWKFFDTYMSQCIVIFAIATVLVFSIVTIILALVGVELSSTLIEYFFKFFGFEMLALSGIKISKHIGSAFGRAEEAVDGSQSYEDVNEDEGG